MNSQNLDIFISILLGIVQGITEFLPISSTAHVRILPAFMDMPDVGAAYTAVIQLGSLIALLYYFRNDLLNFYRESLLAIQHEFSQKVSFTQKISHFSQWNYEARMPFYLIIGTIPIVIFGVLLKDLIKNQFRSLYVISFALILFAIILWSADIFSKKNKSLSFMNLKDALWIGFMQSLALIPGVSRSGITLTAGLLLNFSREASMRYSFLLSIPAIALSGFYELFKDWHELQEMGLNSVFWGTFSAIVVSYLVIAGVLRYLRNHNTLVFVFYRIILGILIIIFLERGILHP